MVHGADNGQFVRYLGGLCKEFGKPHSRDPGGNRFMGASVLRDCFGFGVPSVNVGKTTLLEDDQNIFRLAHTRATRGG